MVRKVLHQQHNTTRHQLKQEQEVLALQRQKVLALQRTRRNVNQ